MKKLEFAAIVYLNSMAKVVHVSEPHDVYVGRGRGSPYGNPFSHKENTLALFWVPTKAEAVERFETWVYTQPSLLLKIKTELPGKTLACWCKPGAPCHARVIFKIANGYYPDSAEKNVENNLFD